MTPRSGSNLSVPLLNAANGARAAIRDERKARSAALSTLGYRSYLDYLDDPNGTWAKTRGRWWASREAHEVKCEICGRFGPMDLHHLTYERLGAEADSDLAPLCGRCHFDLEMWILRPEKLTLRLRSDRVEVPETLPDPDASPGQFVVTLFRFTKLANVPHPYHGDPSTWAEPPWEPPITNRSGPRPKGRTFLRGVEVEWVAGRWKPTDDRFEEAVDEALGLIRMLDELRQNGHLHR